MALLLLIPGIGDKLCLEASGELFQDVFHIGIEIHGFFFSDSVVHVGVKVVVASHAVAVEAGAGCLGYPCFYQDV